MITFACPNCGNVLHVSDEYEGREGICKKCNSRITAPPLFDAPAMQKPKTPQSFPKKSQSALRVLLVVMIVVIVVIVALALLHAAAFSVTGIAGKTHTMAVEAQATAEEARVRAAEAQIVLFKVCLTSYNLAFGRFPATSEGLDALIRNEKRSFMDSGSIPTDPWGKPYVYTLEGPRQFKIISYGADGQPGGIGYNADISSDNLKGTK